MYGLIRDVRPSLPQSGAIVVLAGTTWFPVLRAMATRIDVRDVLKRLNLASWVIGPSYLAVAAFVGNASLARSSMRSGAIAGVVIALLFLITGSRQQRTVWRNASGNVVAASPWRTTGSFVGGLGGLLVLPVLGSIAVLAYAGGKVLGFW